MRSIHRRRKSLLFHFVVFFFSAILEWPDEVLFVHTYPRFMVWLYCLVLDFGYSDCRCCCCCCRRCFCGFLPWSIFRVPAQVQTDPSRLNFGGSFFSPVQVVSSLEGKLGLEKCEFGACLGSPYLHLHFQLLLGGFFILAFNVTFNRVKLQKPVQQIF